MKTLETIEYSVCEDCLLAVAHDENGGDIEAAIERELNGRAGHFSCGLEITEDDPEGTGYKEFTYRSCELCRSALGGSRYGVTLFITSK